MSLLQLLFSYHGRIGRADWWFGYIISFVVVKVIAIITHYSIPDEFNIAMFNIQDLTIGMLFGLLYFWIHVCLNIKRWHDLSKSGWYIILNLIPVIGVLISLIVLGFIKGSKDDNKYGEKA